MTVEEGDQSTTGLILKNIEVSSPGTYFFKVRDRELMIAWIDEVVYMARYQGLMKQD